MLPLSLVPRRARVTKGEIWLWHSHRGEQRAALQRHMVEGLTAGGVKG